MRERIRENELESEKMDYSEMKKVVGGIGELLNVKMPKDVFPKIIFNPHKNPINLDENETLPIEDFLGKYSYNENPKIENLKIEFFVPNCEEMAKELGFPTEIIMKIVFCHEAAHFVTHNPGNLDWVDFDRADRGIKEKFAQIITLLFLHQVGDSTGEAAFRALARKQSDPYNEWLEWDYAKIGNSFEKSRATVQRELREEQGNALERRAME